MTATRREILAGLGCIIAAGVAPAAVSGLRRGIGVHLAAFGGKRAPSARDYVQDGLIAQWDGIKNQGYGLPHDASAANWVDCKRSNRYFPVGDVSNFEWAGGNSLSLVDTYSAGQRWTSCQPTSGVGFTEIQSAMRSGTFCYEICFASQIVVDGVSDWMFRDSSLAFLAQKPATAYCTAYYNSNGQYVRKSMSVPSSVTMCATLSSETGEHLYVNGVSAGTNSTAWTRYTAAGGLQLGSTGTAGRKIHAIRIYDRHLTADEIAKNYALDKARFNI